MQAKMSEEQFDSVVQLSFPSYLLKMNAICLDRCAVDLSKPEGNAEEEERSAETSSQHTSKEVASAKALPQVKRPGELLYLSDREAACIEACSRLYIRQTHAMVDHFKHKLTF